MTANNIFKRFRYVFKTDALYEDLVYCLEGFSQPVLNACLQVSTSIQNSTTSDLFLAMETMRLIARIFFSLNWQDIPEVFEDNVSLWMIEFAKYLSYNHPSLEERAMRNTAEPGPVESLQAAIVDNLVLYATKYEEVFEPFLGEFTSRIWQLLLSVNNLPRYDNLATISIKFLITVSSKHMNRNLFNDSNLQQIIESIVVPNLMATNLDEDIFENNPLDYIRKDIEGTDQDTRRRCAMDLVRSLLKFFAVKVSSLCIGYIDAMLQQYTVTKDWRAKDAALHLVLAVSVISSSITLGAGDLNPNVNILQIFETHVLPELHDTQVHSRTIVKADAIKLICTFRTHFPVQFLMELLPHLIRYLSSESVVVQTYAALTIEKFLTIRDQTLPNKPLKLSKEHINPVVNSIFSGLFAVLDNADLPENDYVMKCVMRVLSVIGSDVIPVTELILAHLTSSLHRICKNPTNPHYNHYLFECMAILIKSCCWVPPSETPRSPRHSNATAQFESLLFPPFQAILQEDVVEFIPYVFQILAQLLSFRSKGMGLSDAYKSLLPPLLSPALYDRKGNVPALTELLVSYVQQGIKEIIAARQLDGMLGVFQKLLATKVWDITSYPITVYNLKLACNIVYSI